MKRSQAVGSKRQSRLLRAFFAVLGAVAVGAGGLAVATGAEGQLGGNPAGASVDSEYRFYAALWIAYGIGRGRRFRFVGAFHPL